MNMKILMLSNVNLGGKAAPAAHMIEVMKNLKKEGHNVMLFAPNIGKYSQDLPGIKYIPTLNIRGIGFIISDFFLCIYTFIYFLKFKPDVVYIRCGMLSASTIMSKILRLPCIVEINGVPFDEINTAKKQNYLWYIIEYIIKYTDWWASCNFSNKIVAVSEGIKKELYEKYKVPYDKIIVIPNGANTDLFKPMDKEKIKEELNLDKRIHYVCFVGNLAQWQGVEYLIKASPLILKKIPNIRFLIVGDGVMKEELIRMVKELNLEANFIFIGIVDYELVPKYINASDICVAPFVGDRKCSPVKVYEYMACRKPIVTTKMPDVIGFLKDGKTALIVEPKNSKDLSYATIKILKDKKLADYLSKNTFELSKEYSWNATAKKVVKVCEDVIK